MTATNLLDTPCLGGPLDGEVVRNVGPALKYLQDGFVTWHLYRAAWANNRRVYRYVGVVEEAKK